ncbi:hypothetical protein [Mesonia sp. K4-1]|uniref:hypothetical protein n=1 Tax=Mesonia sp. K4-1 TaxID=2602760 RepID=UPI0011CC8931|nr:hypothetical protein [Mesonia sp. K4-1]TXK78719.1 hypothetical protein FT986_02685 [Mesonia sp. K4-1]
MEGDILNKLQVLEAHASLILKSVTGLRKELEDSGASESSSRKGKISPQEKAKILGKRHKNRMKKATR